MTARKARSAFRMSTHLYTGDGVPDHHGHDRCQQCGLAATHPVHDLPGTDPDVTANEARRIGET